MTEGIGGCIPQYDWALIEENWHGNEFVTDGWDVENFISGDALDRPMFSYCVDANDRLENIRFFGGVMTFICIDWWNAATDISKTFYNLPGHF